MINPASGPLTRAESTLYKETSCHADVMAYLSTLEARGDPRFHLGSFGVSPEGRELPLVVLSRDGISTPQAAHASGLPVMLVINGIHAGEVEGKEASMMLMRDLLSGPAGDVLDRLIIVVVPLFNPDGNDRIDPANRRLDLAKLEGQRGPESGVGTRVNASGTNLNRDYLAMASQEMRLLATRVYQPWAPHLTVDCHATNGSIHRYVLTYDTAHTVESGRGELVTYVRERFLPEVTRRLAARTGMDTFFYGNFVQDEGGTGQGWMTYTHHPRFGSNYRGLTNRLDILAETYSYLTFHDRVFATYEFLWEVMLLVADRGPDIVELVSRSQAPRDRLAVRYRLEAFPQPVPILTREPRTPEGAPSVVHIPHLAQFVGTTMVDRPFAYAVPPSVGEALARHGLTVRPAPESEIPVEVATVQGASSTGARKILESASGAETEFTVEYQAATRRLPPGTRIVETLHGSGAVAVYLCEGNSDDGAVACGLLPPPQPGDEYPILRIPGPV